MGGIGRSALLNSGHDLTTKPCPCPCRLPFSSKQGIHAWTLRCGHGFGTSSIGNSREYPAISYCQPSFPSSDYLHVLFLCLFSNQRESIPRSIVPFLIAMISGLPPASCQFDTALQRWESFSYVAGVNSGVFNSPAYRALAGSNNSIL